MDKMRGEFEEFIAKEFQFSDQPRNDGSYRCTKINDLWLAWKTSRAALCVELPESCKGMALTVDEFHAQLEKAGVSYK